MWCFRLLGPFRLERDGVEIAVGSPQTRTVLTMLVWRANEVVPVGRLSDELWGDAPPSSAKVQLQGIISRLRRLLGKDRIATAAHGYVLRADVAEIDVAEVRADLERARELISGAEVELGAALLREALRRWRGPVDPLTTEPVAEQLDELRMTVFEECVDAGLALGTGADLIGELTAAVAEHPLRERVRAQLMTALARRGRVSEALDAFLVYRRTMIDELGVEPSPALRALHARILRGEPDVRPAFPVPRKAHRPRQLPPELPDFVSRDDLLAELAGVLTTQEQPRVVVISGAAGLGKTAFAVQLAHRVRERFPDGQLYASLRGDDTMAVLQQFLRALGVPADLVPSGEEECSALLRDLLVGREVLLVLDNAADASQVRPFVPAEPGCAVLVTSRRGLGELAGARRVRLGLFDADESAELLTKIAGVPPGAGLVAHCGGLPLALRIAGARLLDNPHWTSDDLAARLADERTRLDWLEVGDLDVRASFGASYRQLPPAHQQLFRRLGSLRATTVPSWIAAALLDTERPCAERALEDLVGWHLVTAVGRGGASRYGMHDLLRCFAAEQAEPDQDAVLTRALGAWLAVAESMAHRLPACILKPAPGTAFRHPVAVTATDPIAWFDTELPALQAAVETAAAHGLTEHAWELAVACQQYFDHCGHNDAWLLCSTMALSAVSAGPGRAALLRGLGQLHIYWDRYDEARAALEESHEISAELGDRPGVARALTGLATLHRVTGQDIRACELYTAALPLLVETGERHGEIAVRAALACGQQERGNVGEARLLLSNALRRCAELGDDHRTAAVLRRAGEFYLARAEPEEALDHLLKSLHIMESIQDRRCTAHVRLRAGRAYAMQGDHAAAVRTLVEAGALFVELGDGKGEADCALALGELTGSR